MKKVLVVVDMQNDFIDGALGTKEAQAIVGRVAEKIRTIRRTAFMPQGIPMRRIIWKPAREKTSPFPTASGKARAGRSGKRSGRPCPMR